MGGELTVSSEPGQGSRFEFAVAFKRLPEEQVKPDETAADDLQGTRILVVDEQCHDPPIGQGDAGQLAAGGPICLQFGASPPDSVGGTVLPIWL